MQPYSIDERSQNLIKDIWNDMSTGKQYDSYQLRQVIKESWLRCKSYGLDPYCPKVFSLTQSELKALKHGPFQTILETAYPFMEQLYEIVRGSGFVVMLCNHEGFLLELVGDQDVIEDAQNITLSCGVNWSEQYMGTTAIGDMIESGPDADIKIGNALPLKNIPIGTEIHNIELKAGKGAQMVRSAGNSAQLMAKEGNYASIRLPSGEVRKVRIECRATIGEVGNIDHENIKIGKAGRKRHMGFRPTVRGSAMNPNDHPHGGGEGKTGIGRVSPITPWGKPTIGYKTRKKNKPSDQYIVKKRKEK
jgi:hypothetical protein